MFGRSVTAGGMAGVAAAAVGPGMFRAALAARAWPLGAAAEIAWPVLAVFLMVLAAAGGLWLWGHGLAAGQIKSPPALRSARMEHSLAAGRGGALVLAIACGGMLGGFPWIFVWPDEGPPGGASAWMQGMGMAAAVGLAMVSAAAAMSAILGRAIWVFNKWAGGGNAWRPRPAAGQTAASLILAAMLASPWWSGAAARRFAGFRASPAAERVLGWTAPVPGLSAAFPSFRPDLRPPLYMRWRGPMADLPRSPASFMGVYLAAAAMLFAAGAAACPSRPPTREAPVK